jgi:hypothetical protein
MAATIAMATTIAIAMATRLCDVSPVAILDSSQLHVSLLLSTVKACCLAFAPCEETNLCVPL